MAVAVAVAAGVRVAAAPVVVEVVLGRRPFLALPNKSEHLIIEKRGQATLVGCPTLTFCVKRTSPNYFPKRKTKLEP